MFPMSLGRPGWDNEMVLLSPVELPLEDATVSEVVGSDRGMLVAVDDDSTLFDVSPESDP